MLFARRRGRHYCRLRYMMLPLLLWMVTIISSIISLSCSQDISNNNNNNNDDNPKSVSIIGLGGMGIAITKCLLQNGYHVHGWNRTPKSEHDVLEKLQSMQDNVNVHENRLTIHSTPQEAFQASNTIMFVINSTPNLQSIKDILLQNQDDDDNLPMQSLQNKVIINMVNHDPFSEHELHDMLQSSNVHLVSALMFGVPETVCSLMSHLIVSSSNGYISNDDKRKDTISKGSGTTTTTSITKSVQQILGNLGRVHIFDYKNDVGMASIVYLGLIQSLYFGLAGYELSLLILKKYMMITKAIDDGDEATKSSIQQHQQYQQNDIMKRFQHLASKLLSTYIPNFMPIISNTIVNQEWNKSYVPAKAVIDMFEMHQVIFDRLHLVKDNYHTTYIKYLKQLVEQTNSKEEAEQIGVSAVVQQYSTDNFRLTNEKEASISLENERADDRNEL